MPKSHDQPLCVKSLKNTHIRIWQNLELVSHVPSRPLNIPSFKALTEKLTPGIPKMPKPHDQPLCAYLMRYNAHLQSHPRPWPKWYIYHTNWKPMKIIQIIVRTASTHDRAPGFIMKSVKNSGKIQILKFSKTRDISCVPIRSLQISSLKTLGGKLTSECQKMPKSHDQTLCAYLMKYDAHIQSHPRSSPKWYICQ